MHRVGGDNFPNMHKGGAVAQGPSPHFPQLSEHRLRIVSEALLDVLFETERLLDSPLDDGYTRGTATFGRQRNSLITLCQSGQYGWLQLTNPGMDVTFEIEGVPCRFFADDPSSPKKPGFYKRNESDQLFPGQSDAPVMFRFIVAKPQVAEEEPDVHFVGFDSNHVEVFRWKYSTSTPVIVSVDDSRPESVDLSAAEARSRLEAESKKDDAEGKNQ